MEWYGTQIPSILEIEEGERTMKHYQGVDYQHITITDGFWKHRQEVNAQTTAYAVYNRFSDSHRFEALDCKWNEHMNYKPHIFWDSDVAKWIEGAAYVLQKTKDEKLELLCEKAIDSIVSNQTEEGYFNSHFLVMEQEERFKHRSKHELYCAGHLMEAACAYYEATGKDRFLKVMCKYADYIYDVFYVYQTASFATCGHPEIELALVRLYETTGVEKYLELAKSFIDKHGNNTKDGWDVSYVKMANKYYAQDQMPLKKQRTAEGHSVRALYLYSAMADIARLYEDEEYEEACEAIFHNIAERKMYITGGVGSNQLGESFATEYYLPNEISYTETCAAISLALFCKRMQKTSVDSKYADVAERVIYNGFLSGVSLDGKSFFYTNPLEIRTKERNVNTSTIAKRWLPITQRVELFSCSCCPPNVFRFLSSIQELMYTHDEETLFVHQFMDSTAQIGQTTVTQTTQYPADGAVRICLSGKKFQQVAVRIPGWCSKFTANAAYTLKDGYAYFAAAEDILVTFEMPVVLYEANNAVQNNAGRVAVTRGPIVYCLEAVDNGEQLRSIHIKDQTTFTLEECGTYQVPVICAEGYRKKGTTALYQQFHADYEAVSLRWIPYFAFANRGESEMLIWVDVK